MPGGRRGCRRDGPGHPALADPPRPLELGQVPDRRELRDDLLPATLALLEDDYGGISFNGALLLSPAMYTRRRWRPPEGSASIFSDHLNVTGALRAATAQNRDLRLLVLNGYHDLTISFFGAAYMLAH